jgi:capsular exopolysaccharide synthesis family protein
MFGLNPNGTFRPVIAPVQTEDTSVTLSLVDLWTLLMMQRVLVAVCVGGSLAISLAYSLVATPQYRATAVVQLSIQAGQEIQTAKVVDLDQYNRWNRDMFVQTNLEILHSRNTREEVVRRYRELGYDDAIAVEGASALISLLDAQARPNSELIDLSIAYSDPEKAAVLANLTAEVYREQNLGKLRDAAADARVWLRGEIAATEDRLSEIAAKRAQYMVDNGMAAAQRNVEAVTTQATRLQEAYAEVKTKLAVSRSQLDAQERLFRAGQFEELAKELGTPLVVALTNEYAQLVTRHASVTARYGEQHPERQYVEAELERFETEIAREVQRTLSARRATLGVLDANATSLETEMSSVATQLADARQIYDGYERLEREHERTKIHFAQLNQRYDELDLQARTRLNNVRVLDAAQVPEHPFSPMLMFNTAIALVFGLLGGISLGLLREYLDDSIATPLDVSAYLHVPYLGHVPRIDSPVSPTLPPELYTFEHPKSVVAESMRAIRTIIDMSSENTPVRTLLVTSAVSSEGKTGTSVRTGVTFAQLGRRVLLIDADLRRPRLHRIFDTERGPGLTDALNGKPLPESVRPSPVPGLFVLPVGTNADNSTELLASPEMQRVIAEARDHFDIVIIDTPPSTLIADAAILSRSVDGIVVVVRENAASRRLVQQAVSDLRRVGGHLLGVVINDVDLKRGRNSYRYYYGYGRRYYAEETQQPDTE